MVVSESESIAYGRNGNTCPSHQQDQDSLKETSSVSPLAAAGAGEGGQSSSSLLSLTLNEIQHKSGKSFGSMNMDDFLANLWSVDENQGPSQPNQHQPTKDNNNNSNNSSNNGILNQPPLARQGSFSIPAPLCKKTVDEVWFEIQKDRPEHQNSTNTGPHEPPQRQLTLGEMTLEDFLVKAGVVREAPGSASSQQKIVNIPGIQNISLDAVLGMGQVMGIGFSAAHHQRIGNNFSAGNDFTSYQMFPSDASNGKHEEGQQQSKKRILDGPPEVVVERRQRRMIKNRESAARSRARKQVLL